MYRTFLIIGITLLAKATAFAADAPVTDNTDYVDSSNSVSNNAPVVNVTDLPPGNGIRVNTDFKPINLPDAMNQNYGIDTINSFIQFIAGSLIELVGGVAVLMFVISGYMFVTAGGDQGRIDKAKEIIKYTIFGLLLIILSFAIVRGIIQIILEVDKF